ncbi:hypothetical protein OCC_01164 [Thermococcus litoralis DSM 5473]|uniref:CGP-CTERM sorting domain-containing protein n=1 Tax=Thermococcus litoralis (strain ATCC 51850 / DSM 5473 / JCM 8560 / NS-C) TaxID=523849 RepID=H3ZLU4_THELN|nr:hypothetical protein [Thermococcus litoralis]EHR79096.1 hypothetical protein OCC_01164 [Thermococcus litoralis DSM 5473]
MKFKFLASFVLLFSLLAHSPSYAAPTLTVDFCSSGFQVTVAPTTEGVIYVSTGFYNLKPQNFGECIAEYDPTTQRAHFYLVNSSGAHHIGWYYEYGYQNKTLSELLTKVKRSVLPVPGKLEGDYVVFLFNSTTYKVPIKELLSYLWSGDLLNNLVAFSYEEGIIIVPSIKIDAVENNFTVIKRPGKRVGTTLLDFNFTYWLSYQYLLYLNGTIDGRFLLKEKAKKELITWEKLSQLFDKPLYVFYFDGESLKPYPLLRIKISPELKGFKLSIKYEFENLAPPYATYNIPTTAPASSEPKSLNSTANSDTYYVPEDTKENTSWIFLLLVIIVSLALIGALHLKKTK